MSDTRERLMTAAVESLREDGIAALSARAIAARAGVNQALIFYHYKTLDALIEAAVHRAVDDSVEHYRNGFAEVSSLVELLQIGRELHEREQAAGNVRMMAQLMAGAQHDRSLAAAARYAMAAWTVQIESVVRRVLVGSPLATLTDPAGLARAISAGFIGLELYDGADHDGAVSALAALEQLGVLVQVVEDLGPVARRAVAARVRRTARR